MIKVSESGENLVSLSCQEVIRNRRSIRKFDSRPVPADYLEQMIEAARLAPSGTNRQPWRFVLLDSKKDKEKIAGIVPQPFVLEAPVVFICCFDRNSFTRGLVKNRLQQLVEANVVSEEVAGFLSHRKMPERVEDVVTPSSAYLDLGIAVEHMVLQATALGLGSCWVRLFDARKLHEALGLPGEIEVIALLPIGYPAHSPPPRPRLSREEIMIEPEKQSFNK